LFYDTKSFIKYQNDISLKVLRDLRKMNYKVAKQIVNNIILTIYFAAL